MIGTVVLCAAFAGLLLIGFLVVDSRRARDPDRPRRLRLRAVASQLQAQSAADSEPAPDSQELHERAAIEARLEAERRRSALAEGG